MNMDEQKLIEAFRIASNPQAIIELLDELEKEKASRIAAQNEVIELKDAVLKAESTASRVPLLLTELESLRSERTAWRVTAENAEKQLEDLKASIGEPVAWMRDDGEEGSISTMTNCCSAKVKDLWTKANPLQVERYTIPLYALLEKTND